MGTEAWEIGCHLWFPEEICLDCLEVSVPVLTCLSYLPALSPSICLRTFGGSIFVPFSIGNVILPYSMAQKRH